MAEDFTVAPAYGGMFRPPQRRVGVIVVGVIAVVAVVIAGVASAVFLWQRHSRLAENGRACGGSCSAHAKCVRDPGDFYCATECDGDGDCPSAFVCDPTLSGRHHVCLKAGADMGGGVHRRSRGR